MEMRCEHVPAAPGTPGLRGGSCWLSVATHTGSMKSSESPATTLWLQTTNISALHKSQTGVRVSEAKSSSNKEENMPHF